MRPATSGPRRFLLPLLAFSPLALAGSVSAQAPAPPTMTDPRLGVRTVISGLVLPINMAFIGPGEFLLLEKNSGQVLRVKDGVNMGTVLDLGVNNFSERGLLGIALHPDFPDTPSVYLYWTCRTDAPPANRFVPDVTACSDANLFTTDTNDTLSVPLLANRIDRFRWDGTQLTYDKNLIKIRQFQNDSAPDPPGQGDQDQPARGNHDGGVLAFGPDGKLYAYVGDAGRRGQLQNLPSGPTLTGLGTTMADDQFGGPQPDNAHFAGVILRLNEDGSTPTDNPFYAAGAAMGGEVGANVQKIFAYGLRNSFGMAFDPESGNLWEEENGEDAFDEINLVEAGMNGGWIQFMGPASRIGDYREIETTSLHGGEITPNLQQLRWGPERIALTEAEARARLFELPGSHYSDPEFSWKHVIAPAAIGFVDGNGLGKPFAGDLFVGLAVPLPDGGPLLRFHFAGNRRKFLLHDSRLKDGVADNPTFDDLTESEELQVGRDFGIVTSIVTGPNGNLFVVSLSKGAVFEIFGQDKKLSTGLASTATERVDGASVGVAESGAPGERVIGFASEPRPNPTSGTLSFRIALATAGHAVVRVVDTRGRLIAEPLNRTLEAGDHAVAWDGRTRDGARAAAGVYYIHLAWPGFSDTRRVALMP